MTENEGATPVVEDQVAEQETPVSMDDTIRETLRSMKERGLEPEPQAAPEDAEQKAQRIRDEQGKFAAAKPVDATAPAVDSAVDAPQVDAPKAPNTWKKEAAEKFGALDPIVRAEIERREGDFFKGIEQYKQRAEFAQSMERAIAPHMQTINALGISPDKAIGELMNVDAILRYGAPHQKQAKFAELAKAYGIDLGQTQNLSQTDYQLAQEQQRRAQAERELQEIRNQGQQAQEATLNSEIASFAADPKHSHFESVKGHISALLQAGQAKDLADAYEQAIYANPTTRAVVLAEQQAAARAEATRKAQEAKASASVNTRPRPAMPVLQPIGTMEDTIRATYRRLNGSA